MFLKKASRSLFLATISSTLLLSLASSVFAESRNSTMLRVADKKLSGVYVRTNYLELLKKPFNKDAKKKVLVFGDSHSQDLINMIIENNFLKDYQIVTRNTPTQCQPILGPNKEKYLKAKDKALCKKSDNLEKAKDQIKQADLVLIAANWKDWSAKELPTTIKNLDLKPQQKLIILGRKSFGKISVRKYLRKSDEQLKSLRNKVDGYQENINEIMKGSLDPSIYVDVQQLICKSSTDCPIFTPEVKLISYDGGHLTKAGAKYIGSILFKDTHFTNL